MGASPWHAVQIKKKEHNRAASSFNNHSSVIKTIKIIMEILHTGLGLCTQGAYLKFIFYSLCEFQMYSFLKKKARSQFVFKTGKRVCE